MILITIKPPNKFIIVKNFTPKGNSYEPQHFDMGIFKKNVHMRLGIHLLQYFVFLQLFRLIWKNEIISALKIRWIFQVKLN